MNILNELIKTGDIAGISNYLSQNQFNGGCDYLISAVHSGRIKVVKLLGEHYKNIDCFTENNIDTPLMRAAWKGYENIVKYLIEKGAEINKQNRYGWTPLMLAATEGRTSVVKILIEKGADVSIVGYKPEGITALSTAKEFGYTQIVEIIERNGTTKK